MGSGDHRKRQHIENKEDRGRKLVARVILVEKPVMMWLKWNALMGVVYRTQNWWAWAQGVPGAGRWPWPRAGQGEGAASAGEGASQATGWRPAEEERAAGWREHIQEAGGGGQRGKGAIVGEEEEWECLWLLSLWEAGETCQRKQEGRRWETRAAAK